MQAGLPIRQTTSDAVAAALRVEILSGAYEPGERLRQDEVAERLGVSITPVREAFTLLRAEGLLHSDAHRGVEVFAPTASDLRELYEARIALERLAVRHATESQSEETFAELDRLVGEMSSEPDHDRYFELNKQFHATLYGAAQMPRLSRTVQSLRDASDVYLHLFVVELGQDQMWAIREASDGDHRALVAACRSGDPAAAEQIIEAHLRRSLAAVTGLLESREETA